MYARDDQTAHRLSCPQDKRWATVVMESCVMRKYHAQFGERDRETRLSRGRKVRSVPTPRSPLLANIALHGLEQEITSAFPALVQTERWKPTVVRYADDLVVLHSDKAVIEQVQQLVSAWLAGMGLALKPSKTCITHTLTPCENHLGFDFLGFVRHESCTRGCCD